MNRSRIYLTIVGYNHDEITVAFEIDDFVVAQFKPLDICRDGFGVVASRGNAVIENSYEMHKVFSLREGVAKELSNKLTYAIVEAMSKNDTFDGYNKGEY